MKKLLKSISIFSLAVLLIFTSCKKDIELVSVVLKSDNTQVDAGNFEKFKFTVVGNDGKIYTGDSEIYINGTKLSGSLYTPDDAETIEAYAVVQGITSETISLTAVNNLSGVVLENATNVLTNKRVTFQLIDNYGNDVSRLADFFIDDIGISSYYFTPATTGTITVYATYRGFTSNVLDISAYDATHTTKVLAEDFTGIWCGYCPRVAYKLEEAVNNNQNIIPIGVHYGDVLQYENVNSMLNTFDVSGFPTAILNRTSKWGENESEFTGYLNNKVGLGLSVGSTKTDNNISITTQVHFDIDYIESLKLVVCIVEDGISGPEYDQANYENYYTGNPIVGFVHNNVMQKAYTDIYGDNIPSNETVRENTYEKTFNVTVPSNVQNSNNTKIIAFVVNSETKEVINVQKADINAFQDFD